MNNSSELDENKKTKLTKSKSDTHKPSAQLKSVELVKNIGLNKRKVGRDECINPKMQNLERQMSKDQMIELLKSNPVTATDSDQSMGSTADSISSHSSEGAYSDFKQKIFQEFYFSGYEVKLAGYEKDKDNIHSDTNKTSTNQHVII